MVDNAQVNFINTQAKSIDNVTIFGDVESDSRTKKNIIQLESYFRASCKHTPQQERKKVKVIFLL